ncbi:MAG: Ig-like domain-containing protein, partial [Sneathiellales bacterium]|nr:Ig-like domain-containing protein [Sneathiellales bacterium]
DGSGATVTETFTLNVINTNDAPTVDQGIGFQLVETDLAYSFTIPADAFEDVDVGDTLTYTATLVDGSPLPAWLNLSSGGTFSGNPVDGDIAEISIRVTATDSAGVSVFTDFDMKIDSAPDTNEGIIVAEVGDVAEGTISGWDIETPRENLTFELVTGPADGTVVINSDGTYTYTPASNFAGEDSFTYRITDENGLTREGEIDIEIYPGVVPADSGDELVNTTTLSGQERSVVAGLKSGGYVIVWESSNGGGIYSQLYDPDGVKVGTEIAVSSGSDIDRFPEVTALEDGGYAIAWRGRAIGTGSDNLMFVKQYDRDGVALGPQVTVNTNASSTIGMWHDITNLDDGGYIVTWAGPHGPSDIAIIAQRYDANGNTVGGNITISSPSSTPYFQSEPS